MNGPSVRKTLLFTGTILLTAFALSPFAWMLLLSLTTTPDFLVTGNLAWTLENYVSVLTADNLHFAAYLRNSLLVSSVASLAVTVLCGFAGYAVSRLRFPGRVLIPLAMLAISMFPQISIVGDLFHLLSRLGLLNTHTALVLPYTAWVAPLTLWIHISYFRQIPLELDRAALLDGARRRRVLLKVVLPLALPGILSSFLIAFILCFNEFMFAMMLTLDPRAQTFPVGIALFRGIHGELPWNSLMAASALAAVPLVALALIFQRFIVAGLTGGALKG